MKRKIFSILFALVLACSLGLVTAVPVGAVEPPPNPTFATVSILSMTTPSTEITIGWERASDHGLPDIPEVGTLGDAIHVTTSEATLDYAMVIVPTEFTLTTGTEISYWGYTVEESDVKALDEIYLFLDGDDVDEEVDTILLSHKTGPQTSERWGEWDQWTLEGVYTEFRNMWHTLPDYTEVTLEGYIDEGYTVLAIALTAGPTTLGVPVNIDVYFDKLTVDGVVLLDEDTGFIDVPLPLAGFPAASIQDAIDAALPGTTITVAAGIYDPFTVDGKTGLTIQADGVVIVEGAQVVEIVYESAGSYSRDCVVFVKGSTDIVLDGLDIQGLELGTTNPKNYGVIYEDSTGVINDCTVSPNTIDDMFSIAIGIWFGSTVTVDACTIENFGRVGMLIYDGCTAEVLDSTIIGQVYSGEGEVCYGIEVEGAWGDATPETASHVTITGNEIYNCDNTFYEVPTWQSGGVYINGWLEYYPEADSTVIVENNDIHDNYSGIIVIKSPSSYAHFNDIYDNRAFGVEILPAHDATTAVFDATMNWWDDVAGPRTVGAPPYNPYTNFTGGDAVSNNVDYMPWLIQTELQEDWNIYSMPITPDEACLEPFMDALLSANVTAAYYFDSDNQSWGIPEDEGSLDAVYLKMKNPVTVNIWASSWATFPSQKEMKVGWNFVGLAELHPMPAPMALASALFGTGEAGLWGYSQVISPSLNGAYWTYMRAPDQIRLDEPLWLMFPTKGYWVFMVNDGVLGGFTSTPIVEVAEPIPGPRS